MLVEEKEKVISKAALITAMSVFFLSIFIIFLFLSSKAEWQKKIKEANMYALDIENLQKENMMLRGKLDFYRKQDSAYAKLIAMRTFDAKNAENFRIYGLFKDKGRKYTLADIAYKFNIPNEKAIKVTETQGDNWFIVPVKGVHFVRKAETASTIAKKYYTLLSDSILIKQFNPTIKIDNLIFIPYGSESTQQKD